MIYLALVPLLPHYASEFSLSAAEIGLLFAVYPLFVALASLPAGVACERKGSWRILVYGSGLLVAATVGFAYAATSWQLWLARGTQGLAAGLIAPAGMSIIAGRASETRRGSIIGASVSLQGLGTLAGPALGGFAAPALGIKGAFFIAAGFGFVVLLGMLHARSERTLPPTRVNVLVDLARPLRSIATRASLAAILILGLVGSSIQTLLPLRLSDAGYSTSDLGGVLVLAAAIGLVTALLAGRAADRQGSATMLLVWSVTTTLLVVALALPIDSSWFAVAFFVVIVSTVRVGGTLAYVRGAEYAPLGGGLAAGYGLLLAAWSLAAGLGPIAAGVIADATSDHIAFLTVAVLIGLLVIPASRRSDFHEGPGQFGVAESGWH